LASEDGIAYIGGTLIPPPPYFVQQIVTPPQFFFKNVFNTFFVNVTILMYKIVIFGGSYIPLPYVLKNKTEKNLK
jgi:hypothetical protein